MEERRKAELDRNAQFAVMANDISYIKTAVVKIETIIEEKYVTKLEFEPVKRIVCGLVGLILIAVVGALVSLVVMK